MPIETLQVSANSTPNNWTLSAGASKPAAVASPDDDATSYISSGTSNNTQQQFAVADSVLPSTAAISSVVLKSRCKRGGAQNVNFQMTAVLGASTSAGASQTGTSAFAAFSDTFASKPGGGAWTPSDVNSLEIRIQNTQARDLQCTTFCVEVNYTLTVTNTETSTGTETGAMSGSLSGAESGAGSESKSLSGSLDAQSETSTGSETNAAAASLTQAESGIGSEANALSGESSQTEAAPGTEASGFVAELETAAEAGLGSEEESAYTESQEAETIWDSAEDNSISAECELAESAAGSEDHSLSGFAAIAETAIGADENLAEEIWYADSSESWFETENQNASGNLNIPEDALGDENQAVEATLEQSENLADNAESAAQAATAIAETGVGSESLSFESQTVLNDDWAAIDGMLNLGLIDGAEAGLGTEENSAEEADDNLAIFADEVWDALDSIQLESGVIVSENALGSANWFPFQIPQIPFSFELLNSGKTRARAELNGTTESILLGAGQMNTRLINDGETGADLRNSGKTEAII